MRRIIAGAFLITFLVLVVVGCGYAAGTTKTCIWNHSSASEYEDLNVQPLAGWTIASAFFEDVEGENTLGVFNQGQHYIDMKSRRDSYESYYDTRMSDISDLVDDLNTELSITNIETKLDSIHYKMIEIDAEYLDAIQDMRALMDMIDEDLYDDYLDFLVAMW